MERADFRPPRRSRLAIAAGVVLLHAAAVAVLVRAFAPDLGASVAERVTAVFAVTVTTPTSTPSPPPPPPPQRQPERQGAAGATGRKATSRAVVAPPPRIVIASQAAPLVASTGSAAISGARDAGAGTGAGGAGSGSGAGGAGSGSGGGLGAKPVKIAGDISSARDYPAATRDLRLGDDVIVALTVGTDGRVRGCRIVRASRDAQADRITCSLATDRFRFRPARDAAGNPVEALYGWRQRWFRPGEQ